ncbi:MAG: NAD(P)/FAD-dependent oxidoreductase [Rhizobiaceae bacterium]
MTAARYQSPISPGFSFYEETAGDRPEYAALNGDSSTDILIIGGGFTGLSAAVHLARNGADVTVVEAHRFGDGASGRNGGQMGTGQRAWPEELEAEFGLERAKALFTVAEEAKSHLMSFMDEHGIDAEFRSGQLSFAHKRRYVDDYKRHADIMGERFGYPHISYLDRLASETAVGSTFYHGGVRDTGTGHIHPLKLVIGTARAATGYGAKLHEQTAVIGLESGGGRVTAETGNGTITAQKCLLAVNAHGGALEAVSAAHVMPIGSFIGATEPLGEDSSVIPGWESVDDSRFVVRYFRKSKDGRLLFGGRESYGSSDPANIEAHIRKQIAEIYPELRGVGITHTWGGRVGITMPRKPFVREVMPNVISCAGYSGHGVMLSNYTGRLYAETVLGNDDKLKLFKDLNIPAFPGGRRFRAPLLTMALGWYALRDAI